MEILIFIAGLVALDILANVVGPNRHEVEAALRLERDSNRPPSASLKDI